MNTLQLDLSIDPPAVSQSDPAPLRLDHRGLPVYRVKAVGVPAKKRYPRVTVDVASLIALYEGGATIRQVADTAGTSAQTVWRRLRYAGYVTRRPGPKTPGPFITGSWHRAAAEMERQGRSLEDIAEHFGVSISAVRYALAWGVGS